MKYICTYCSVYVYDTDNGDPVTELEECTTLNEIPDTWHCPVCGMPKDYLQQIRENVFSLN